MAMVNEEDPFAAGRDDLWDLQLQAASQRLAERRLQIPVLDQLASDRGIDEITSLESMVPLLFADTVYKSYSEAFVDGGRWDLLTKWLATLATPDFADLDLEGISGIDDWLDRLWKSGYRAMTSGGTSGKHSIYMESLADEDFAQDVNRLILGWELGLKPGAGRPCFLFNASSGPYRGIDIMNNIAKLIGRPDDTYHLMNEPMRAGDLNKMGRMRRSIAEGRATPSEVAEFEAEGKRRQERMLSNVEGFLDKLFSFRHEPTLVEGNWGPTFQAVTQGRARGIPDGDFHPDTVLFIGGGAKGSVLPPDFRAQMRTFFGIPDNQMHYGYGTSEIHGSLPACPEKRRPHCPPHVILLVLEKDGESLAECVDGKVEGRAAFLDVSMDGRWGGLVGGDKVVADFNPCPCGRKSPTVDFVSRYSDLPEGDDKLSCSGTIEAYIRGHLTA
jgi:hypothetical protein